MPRTSASSQPAYIKQERTRRVRPQDDEANSELDFFDDGIKQEILSTLAGQGRSARCYGSDEMLEFN